MEIQHTADNNINNNVSEITAVMTEFMWQKYYQDKCIRTNYCDNACAIKTAKLCRVENEAISMQYSCIIAK